MKMAQCQFFFFLHACNSLRRPKLSMQPAPDVHIFRAGTQFSKICTWNVTLFQPLIYHYYVLGGCMEKFLGAV